MQRKNDKYTFLLTHSNPTTIYIRRVEVSKKLVNTSASAALLLSLGLGSFGVARSMFKSDSLVAKASVEKQSDLMAVQSVGFLPTQELKTATYDRPAFPQTEYVAQSNLGGPADFSFRLTNLDAADETKIENQIRDIERMSPSENLPTIWAKSGKINNEFSFRRNPFGGRSYEFHSGLDIDGEKGDVVIAPANGVVKQSGWTGGYGNLLEIDHGNGLTTRYGHLSRIDVKVGDTVVRGQDIALVGSTGRSTGPHLHYEVRVSDKSVNPRRFLPREPQELKEMSDKR
jgi:murein DD-endopeptidase MepM/ murein hydrolase activator NlpD